MNVVKQMLQQYSIQSENDLTNALKEIFQEITLLGLYRGNFFNKAVFYGGTALRILYGLNRFSEDLDFSLLKKEKDFNIENYFKYIYNEFNALGIAITLTQKKKTNSITDVKSAFLKSNTSIHTLNVAIENLQPIFNDINSQKSIKIKIEVDTNPPLNFKSEAKTLLMPITFNIVSMTLPNLYAGKMHAVLCRKWKTRVKGRDWYDFEWYVKRNTKLNLNHLKERMVESGDFERNTQLNQQVFVELINSKIDGLNVDKAKAEVKPFIKNSSELNTWNKDYFRLLANSVLFE